MGKARILTSTLPRKYWTRLKLFHSSLGRKMIYYFWPVQFR